MLSEINKLAVDYAPAILASGVFSPLISAVIRSVQKVKWTHSDLARATFAFLVYAAISAFHMLMTSHSIDKRIVLLQGAVMFVIGQPFFYALVRPAFRQVDTILAKNAAYDALMAAKTAVVTPAVDTFSQP